MAKSKVTIDTSAKRAKLATRRNPYWHGISGGRGGVSIGYRKAARGPGAWVSKLVVDNRRIEERLAPADDADAPAGALSYPAAVSATLAWARQRYAAVDGTDQAAIPVHPTVRSAIEGYVKFRVARQRAGGRDADSRLTKHVLADQTFAATRLDRLSARDLVGWRARIAASLAPATVNRLLNDVRAALNGEAELYRRSLPAGLPGEIKAGTKALPMAENARKQVLTDDEVRNVIREAFAIDPTGDFGRLVIVAAATGARFSQIARLTVGDVQSERQRLLLPTSRKGRGNKPAPHIAVPVGVEVIASLEAVTTGRKPHETLLLRWVHKQVGPVAWEREARKPWASASETIRTWAKVRLKAGLPADIVMLSLRHTSIVRGLKAGLPVRLVAGLHDTSVPMIEKHYSAFIVDASEELARRAIPQLGPSATSDLP